MSSREEGLAPRFDTAVQATDDGNRSVTVTDSKTGTVLTQPIEASETAISVAKRLATAILIENPIPVVKIEGSCAYRDGPFAFGFWPDDGELYDFLLRGDGRRGFLPPELYFGYFNKQQFMRDFTWTQARDFLAPLAVPKFYSDVVGEYVHSSS